MASPEAVPSHMRVTPGSVNIPYARFPTPSTSPSTTTPDPRQVAQDFTSKFNAALEARDLATLKALFLDEGYWRDHLALTWAFRTANGPTQVHDLLSASASSRGGLRLKKITIDDSSAVRAPQVAPVDPAGKVPGVRFFVTVETAVGTGSGVVQLVPQDDGSYKIFTLYTRLEELAGHEQPVDGRRPRGVAHGHNPDRRNWAERRKEEVSMGGDDGPAVLIIGAGQAGLTAAARLKMLGVKALIIDQNDRVGDNWRKRYHQLVLHDPVWYDHMPYLPFPAQWPVFTPKDKLADFFVAYASLLELNVWTSTSLGESAKWDESKKCWEVVVVTDKVDEDGGLSRNKTVLHPRHIIQATGHSGKKNQPTFPGAENFRGDRLCHSSEFSGARPDGRGKKAVVVGSCNSAHDIAQDFAEKGYDVTIVQRSSTCVVSSSSITDIALKPLYSETSPPVAEADLLLQGLPSAVLKAVEAATTAKQADNDKSILEGLAKAGFKTDKGIDGSGLLIKYFSRGGGYYIDVGASQLIADGKIGVKQGQEIAEVLPNGLRFADGSELEADEVVLATGYQSMRSQTRQLLGDAVADKVSEVWGYNEEGEMRTVWQRSGHPGLWLHGGNLALCRYYSLPLALQIKGIEEGLYDYAEV